ncbi:MAG TPA: hypothetical protein VM576_02600 [Xanthomonadaceae bacterium]|nr:hypothetical protein [Xanthomonadaceae bacterium]
MRAMDACHDPYADLDHDALGDLCAQRAEALQARAWRDEVERDALREETARLLQAVALRLGGGVRLDCAALSTEALRDYFATSLQHAPLSTRASARRGAGDPPSRDE